MYIKLYTQKSKPYCSSQQIVTQNADTEGEKKKFMIFIPVVKIYQKGFSQEESDSSNLLLSLMKRFEDVIHSFFFVGTIL